MPTPLLSMLHVTKHYGDVPVLLDAALELLPGECHALMGENGAGKSTLIKILAGVVTPDRAEIRLQGQSVKLSSAKTAFDRGLRFIHQELNVVPQLSVAENIFLSQPYPRRAGIFVHWQKLNQAARDVLATLGIRHIAPGTRMAHLSPGDAMLVKIASAFVGDHASVYVMDEPTAGLTGGETARLFEVIDGLKTRGAAVLYVSHRMDEIFEIADRVTVMRDGQVVATREIGATDAADLIRLMTGRELAQIYPPRTAPVTENKVIEARNLRTRHISGINFSLHSGEIVGIAGLNGSGRSELLRAVMGIDRLIAGELISEMRRGRSPTAAWREGVAYIPEERRTQGLMLARSIRDNMTLPHLNHFSLGGTILQPRRETAAAVQASSLVQLRARHVHQTTHELSGGNQQKILFARAMLQEQRPLKLLLLDEPTRGVDVGAKYDIYTLIRQLSDQGTAILLASSDTGELVGLCDRLLVMRGRQQAGIYDAAALSQSDLLALCYGETSHAEQ
jgi:ribose transport system ATP-binding protein